MSRLKKCNLFLSGDGEAVRFFCDRLPTRGLNEFIISTRGKRIKADN